MNERTGLLEFCIATAIYAPICMCLGLVFFQVLGIYGVPLMAIGALIIIVVLFICSKGADINNQ